MDLVVWVNKGLVKDVVHLAMQLDLIGCDSQVWTKRCRQIMLRLLRRDDRVPLNESVLHRCDALFEGELHLFRLPDGRHLVHWDGQVATNIIGGWSLRILLGGIGNGELSSEQGYQTLLDCWCRRFRHHALSLFVMIILIRNTHVLSCARALGLHT